MLLNKVWNICAHIPDVGIPTFRILVDEMVIGERNEAMCLLMNGNKLIHFVGSAEVKNPFDPAAKAIKKHIVMNKLFGDADNLHYFKSLNKVMGAQTYCYQCAIVISQ